MDAKTIVDGFRKAIGELLVPEIRELRADLGRNSEAIKAVQEDVKDLRVEMKDLRAEMNGRFTWLYGLVAALLLGVAGLWFK